MAKKRPLQDVAEQNDELSLIDEEIDQALDGLKTANEKVVDLLEHIEGTPGGEAQDGDEAPPPSPGLGDAPLKVDPAQTADSPPETT